MKLLDKGRAKAIELAADEVIQGMWIGEFVVDVYQADTGVSFKMDAYEVVAIRANELLGGERWAYAVCHLNDHVNCSQSTNDVFLTAMRLAAVFLFDDVTLADRELAKAFSRKAVDFDRILKLWGYTPDGRGADLAPVGICGLRYPRGSSKSAYWKCSRGRNCERKREDRAFCYGN